MSILYRNGQLHRVIYKDEPKQSLASYLCEVGTKFVFAKQESEGSLIAVRVAYVV